MPQRIAILSYGTGNLHSVRKRLDQLKAEPRVCFTAEQILLCDKLILPGVGHFAAAMQQLQVPVLKEALHEFALVQQRPVLGICLGLQVMTQSSEEAPGYQGLGWLNTAVVRFNQVNNQCFRTPHTGWNTLSVTQPSSLFRGVEPTDEFFFTHAYHLSNTAGLFVNAQTQYGYSFAAAIQQDNLFGVQFHPEKSHTAGETVLENFLSI